VTTTFRIPDRARRGIVFYNPKATRFRYRRLPLITEARRKSD
jgi:hypothetical protein